MLEINPIHDVLSRKEVEKLSSELFNLYLLKAQQNDEKINDETDEKEHLLQIDIQDGSEESINNKQLVRYKKEINLDNRIKKLKEVINNSRKKIEQAELAYQLEKNNKKYKIISGIFMIIPLTESIAITSELATGLNEVDELFNHVHLSEKSKKAFLITVPLVYFIEIMMINLKYTHINFLTVLNLVKKKIHPEEKDNSSDLQASKIAEEWPVLSRKQEKIAAISSFIIVTYPAFTHGITMYYFANQLPYLYGFSDDKNWQNFSIFVGAASSISNLFCDGLETYKSIRQYLARNNNEPNQMLSVAEHPAFLKKYAPLVIGYPLGLIGAMEHAAARYYVMSSSFSIKNKWVLFLVSLITNGGANLFFHGKMGVEALTEFFHKIYQDVDVKDILALMVSSAFSLFVAEGMRTLIREMLTDPEHSLPFDMPNELITAISIGAAAREGLLCAYMTTPFIRHSLTNGAYSFVEKAKQAGSFLSNSIGNVCSFFYTKKEGPYQPLNVEQTPRIINSPKSAHLFNKNNNRKHRNIQNSSLLLTKQKGQDDTVIENEFLYYSKA